METYVYRISAVLAGQSADVTVVGRDATGRELHLELPRERAHALQAGQLLIFHLSAHVVPELEKPATPATPPESTTTTTVVTSRCGATDDDEICRMLGLG